MRSIFLTLVLCGCAADENPGDRANPDLSALPSALCTSAACAAAPCTAGCVFSATTDNRCPGASRVDAQKAIACRGWCGLQGDYPEGCLRYRDEDPHCPDWCVAWGDASCWERSPAIDYSTGGAICPSGSSCFGGYPLEDASAGPCVDAGADL